MRERMRRQELSAVLPRERHNRTLDGAWKFRGLRAREVEFSNYSLSSLMGMEEFREVGEGGFSYTFGDM